MKDKILKDIIEEFHDGKCQVCLETQLCETHKEVEEALNKYEEEVNRIVNEEESLPTHEIWRLFDKMLHSDDFEEWSETEAAKKTWICVEDLKSRWDSE